MSGRPKVLLTEDNEAFRQELAEHLVAREGFEVSQAGSIAEALEILDAQTFDVMVFDVGLPDGDGRDLCREARKRGVKSPVIMLTAVDSDADTVHGLDSGANDYVAKPVRLQVLMARIRAQLRQFELSDDAVFQIGPYSFKPATKMLVTATDKKIKLTEKETAILKYLYRHPEAPVARETLLGEVWGYNAGVSTHTLETHVYRLRQKIEPVAGETSILITEHGGYRLAR